MIFRTVVRRVCDCVCCHYIIPPTGSNTQLLCAVFHLLRVLMQPMGVCMDEFQIKEPCTRIQLCKYRCEACYVTMQVWADTKCKGWTPWFCASTFLHLCPHKYITQVTYLSLNFSEKKTIHYWHFGLVFTLWCLNIIQVNEGNFEVVWFLFASAD